MIIPKMVFDLFTAFFKVFRLFMLTACARFVSLSSSVLQMRLLRHTVGVNRIWYFFGWLF